MTIDKQIELIKQWAKDRELDKKGTIDGQKIKTAEEIAELIKAISKDNLEEIQDSIGDIFVTLVVGCMLEDVDSKEVFEEACKIYEENFEVMERSSLTLDTFENREQVFRIVTICTLNVMTQDILVNCYRNVAPQAISYLIKLSTEYHLFIEDCIESAYNEIKNRKGKMINGTFVKESDLNA